jgi:hypothetical protein
MTAGTLHSVSGLLALAVMLGCSANEPVPVQSPPSRATSLSLASLPRDLVEGPAGGTPAAVTTSAAPGGQCSGEAHAQLVQAISNRASQSRRCYEKLLRSKPAAEGRYVVSLRLSKRGKVERARLVKDEVGDAEMAKCVLSGFRAASFPAPRGGCADEDVPLNYEPRRSAGR